MWILPWSFELVFRAHTATRLTILLILCRRYGSGALRGSSSSTPTAARTPQRPCSGSSRRMSLCRCRRMSCVQCEVDVDCLISRQPRNCAAPPMLTSCPAHDVCSLLLATTPKPECPMNRRCTARHQLGYFSWRAVLCWSIPFKFGLYHIGFLGQSGEGMGRGGHLQLQGALLAGCWTTVSFIPDRTQSETK